MYHNRKYIKLTGETRSITMFYRVPVKSNHQHKSTRYYLAQELLDEKKFTSESKQHLQLFRSKEKDTYVSNAIDSRLGLELVANEFISKGDFICLYEGERRTMEMCDQLEAQGISTHYMFNLDDEIVIDAFKNRSGASMANHSCNPNSQLMSTYLCGMDLPPIGYLQCIRPIQIGEPITCFYGYSSKSTLDCFCGEVNCTGQIGF